MEKAITKIGGKNFNVDLVNNRIDFLDTRFYLSTDTGAFYPSVTTILESYPKTQQFYEWLKKVGEDADEIRDEAGDKGSTVHRLTEAYDMGMEVSLFDTVTGNINYKLIEWAMFERYVNFRQRFPAEILAIELNIVSDTIKTGGTLDRIVNLNNKRILIDIKTGNSVYKHFWLQMAAYKKLYEEKGNEPIDEVAILHLNALTRTDGKKDAIQGKGWKLMFPDKPIEHYYNLFLNVKNLWTEENEDAIPRQFSYQLSYNKPEKKLENSLEK